MEGHRAAARAAAGAALGALLAADRVAPLDSDHLAHAEHLLAYSCRRGSPQGL